MREQTEHSFHRDIADIQRNADRKCFAVVDRRLEMVGRMIVLYAAYRGCLFLKQDDQNTEQAENPADNHRLVFVKYLEVQALQAKQR